ncbi:unnamed protein product [Rotaria sordida]|uniref:Pentapeptide repeat-containing protein n=1 Tax=Rotaria sordida TaxID=392033 RepID=A0A819G303_9BILA|nr:unnamed protein product [Rotaria sordida]
MVPITIAVYTFIQNDNDQAIALVNREKDLEIAQNQRAQDLKIAEDQQKANILAAYESFLIGHLNRYGMTLNGKTDLSEISLTYRVLKYLSLPKVNLTRSLFAHADLSCVNFYSTILIDSDFTYTSIVTIKNHCFLKSDQLNRTIFAEAIMNNINLCHADFIGTDFTKASLICANISYFVCLECLFVHKNMFRADLNFSRMTMYCNFQMINLTEAILPSVLFRKATFIDTIFTRIQTIEVQFK